MLSLKRKVMVGIQAYFLRRKEKKAMFAKARFDRERMIRQACVLKLIKVGSYWNKKMNKIPVD